jgi:hypothetical protein
MERATLGKFAARFNQPMRVLRPDGTQADETVFNDDPRTGRQVGPKTWECDNGEIWYPIPGA